MHKQNLLKTLVLHQFQFLFFSFRNFQQSSICFEDTYLFTKFENVCGDDVDKITSNINMELQQRRYNCFLFEKRSSSNSYKEEYFYSLKQAITKLQIVVKIITTDHILKGSPKYNNSVTPFCVVPSEEQRQHGLLRPD